MAGIFDQLPDLSSLLEVRGAVEGDLQGAISLIPSSATDVFGSLPDGLGTIDVALRVDPAAATQPLRDLLAEVPAVVDIDLAGAVQSLAEGMTQLRESAAGSVLGELVFAADETRDLREILLAQVPALTAEFIEAFSTMRENVLPAERAQVVIDFMDTLGAFAAELPDDPEVLGDFLARGFLGLPGDLLTGAAAPVERLLGDLDGMADLVANSEVPVRIPDLAARLNSAAHLLADFDPVVSTNYDIAIEQLTAVQGELAGVRASVEGIVAELSGVLDGVQPAPEFASELGAALEALPEIDAIGLDEIKAFVLGPILEANRALTSSSPDEIIARLRAGLDGLVPAPDERRLDDWQADLLDLFEQLRSAIDGLDFAGIRTQLEAALGQLDAGIAELGSGFRDTLVAAIRDPLDAAEAALDGIDLSEAEAAMDGAFGALEGALDQLDLEALATAIGDAVGAVSGAVAELAEQTAALAEQLEQVVGNLADLSVEPVIEPVNEQIASLTETLRQINPDDLTPVHEAALAGAAVALGAVDFKVDITGTLLARIDTVLELPSARLGDVGQRVDSFSSAVLSFDPEALIEPLVMLHGQLTAPLAALDAGVLVAPLRQAIDQARAGLDALSPGQLAAPLTEAYGPVLASLDDLSPAELLGPLAAEFEQLADTLRRLDLKPVFDDLMAHLATLSDQVRQELTGHIEGMGLPEPITDFLTSLTPLLELASPAILADPVNRAVQILDAVAADFQPGDLFQPLQELDDQLTALMSEVPAADLVAAFENVRAGVVDTLDRVDPARLTGRIRGSVQATATFHAALEPAALVAALSPAYDALTVALAGLDEASVPEPLRPRFGELEALVEALDPESVLGDLQGGHVEVAGRLDAAGGVDLDDLPETFASVHARIDALVPDFLREPVTTDTLTAALDALRPDALAAEVNAAADELKSHYANLRDRIVAELEDFAAAEPEVLVPFSLPALAARFQEPYDAILAKLGELDPAPVIAALQGTFDAARSELESLDPSFLTDELTATFERVRDKANALQLDELENRLDALVQAVTAKADALDPVQMLGAAGLFEASAELRAALSAISVAAALEVLAEGLLELRADLEAQLGKTQAAFETMVAAIPVSVSAGFSL